MIIYIYQQDRYILEWQDYHTQNLFEIESSQELQQLHCLFALDSRINIEESFRSLVLKKYIPEYLDQRTQIALENVS